MQKPEQHINWCKKKDRGIKIEQPNDNLCTAYLQKAKSAINILNSAIEKEENDWIATTAYYARYFALYALLQKIGITSEIHDCTLSVTQLLVQEKIIEEQHHKELIEAKDFRIDTQYYVTEEFDKNKLIQSANKAGNFLLRLEQAIALITPEQIEMIRKKIEEA